MNHALSPPPPSQSGVSSYTLLQDLVEKLNTSIDEVRVIHEQQAARISYIASALHTISQLLNAPGGLYSPTGQTEDFNEQADHLRPGLKVEQFDNSPNNAAELTWLRPSPGSEGSNADDAKSLPPVPIPGGSGSNRASHSPLLMKHTGGSGSTRHPPYQRRRRRDDDDSAYDYPNDTASERDEGGDTPVKQETEVEEAEPEPVDPEVAAKEAQQVRDWRFDLQTRFFTSSGGTVAFDEELMPGVDSLFRKIENFEHMKAEYLDASKITKVMLHIGKIPDGVIPRDAEYKFRERAWDLYYIWTAMSRKEHHRQEAEGSAGAGGREGSH